MTTFELFAKPTASFTAEQCIAEYNAGGEDKAREYLLGYIARKP